MWPPKHTFLRDAVLRSLLVLALILTANNDLLYKQCFAKMQRSLTTNIGAKSKFGSNRCFQKYSNKQEMYKKSYKCTKTL